MEIETALNKYRELSAEIDRECSRIRREYNPALPCGSECCLCCLNTSTLFVSAVEGLLLREGVRRLPRELQNAIFEQARRASKELLRQGNPPDELNRLKATFLLKGKPEGICPFLIGGVCSCYDERPIICRVWGYPVRSHDELMFCDKMFTKETAEKIEPVDYLRYRSEARRLSKLIGDDRDYPILQIVLKFCYLSNIERTLRNNSRNTG